MKRWQPTRIVCNEALTHLITRDTAREKLLFKLALVQLDKTIIDIINKEKT